MAGMWLSLFNDPNIQEIGMGGGQAKDNAELSFQMVEMEQVIDIPNSGVSSYVHQDPNFL